MGELVLLDIDVPGDPAPQGSKRLLRSPSGKLATVESSARVAPWRTDVRDAILTALDPSPTRPHPPHTGPVEVNLTFRLRRPAAHHTGANRTRPVRESAPPYHTGKPDVDKLARAVLDAIDSTGIVYVDDAQVAVLAVGKLYASPGEPPGVHITVRSLE